MSGILKQMEALKQERKQCEASLAHYRKWQKRCAKLEADEERRRSAMMEEMEKDMVLIRSEAEKNDGDIR